MSDNNKFPAVISSLPAFAGPFDAYQLNADNCKVLFASYPAGTTIDAHTHPSHSIISDYFPHEERGRALSFYSVGIYIGILIGFLAGGWINQYFGWRVAFLVVGAPGLLLAIIVKLTLREPLRGQMDHGDHSGMPEGHLLVDLKRLWAIRSFRYAAFGAGFNAFLGYGGLNFMPSFAIRLYDIPVGVVGTWLALIVGFAGAAGVYAGGHLSDHLGERDDRWAYWVPGIGTLAAGLLTVPMMLRASST